jgi:hypothetical protein
MKKLKVLIAMIFLMGIMGCSGGGDAPSLWAWLQAPSITSANNTAFTEASAGTFTVTATGWPAPTITLTGSLPDGVTFDAATGVLSGTPSFGTAGVYPLTFTASNGVSPNATQAFTLTVAAQPITSLTQVAEIENDHAQIAICRGNYVYTVGWSATDNSFNIHDMSIPTSPVLRGHYNIGRGSGLALNGNYAYIHTDGLGDGIFASQTVGVMNITDPTNPIPVMEDATGSHNPYQTYYHNGYVYTPSWNIIGIYRVSDPATLVPVTNITTSNIKWLAFSGDYMYGIDHHTFRIWDISNPAVPVETGSIDDPRLNSGGGLAIKGNYVFAMGSSSEILVFDVSDKNHPTLVTSLTLTSGISALLNEARILGNYLLFTGTDDFYVVNITNPSAPVEVTSIRLLNAHGWGFDVLNERYAIVADYPGYRVIQLW